MVTARALLIAMMSLSLAAWPSASCRPRGPGPTPDAGPSPENASVAEPAAASADAGSAPCAADGGPLELRVADVPAARNRTLRVSIKSCGATSVSLFYNSRIAPLDVDAFDGSGVALARTSATADMKFDATPYCDYLLTLAPGEEHLLESVWVERAGGVTSVRSGAIEAHGDITRIEVSFPSLVRSCLDREPTKDGSPGTSHAIPPDAWNGRVVARAVELPRLTAHAGAPTVATTPRDSCACLDLTWANGPVLGSWSELAINAHCDVTVKDHHFFDARDQPCTSQLLCDDYGGASTLAHHLEDPIVQLAIANDVDFGGRMRTMIDGAAQRVRIGKHFVSAPATCATEASCPLAPRAVRDLFELVTPLHAHHDGDGGTPRGLHTTKAVCGQP